MVDIGESRVEEMMTRDIHVLRADVPIDQALFICTKEGLSDIIVIDEEGRYLGVVRSLEILNYINPLLGVHIGRRTMGHTSLTRMNPSIGELMTHAHVAIRKDARLSEDLLHVRRDHHRYLVVVDEDQRVLGKLELCGIIAFLIERGTFSAEKDIQTDSGSNRRKPSLMVTGVKITLAITKMVTAVSSLSPTIPLMKAMLEMIRAISPRGHRPMPTRREPPLLFMKRLEPKYPPAILPNRPRITIIGIIQEDRLSDEIARRRPTEAKKNVARNPKARSPRLSNRLISFRICGSMIRPATKAPMAKCSPISCVNEANPIPIMIANT